MLCEVWRTLHHHKLCRGMCVVWFYWFCCDVRLEVVMVLFVYWKQHWKQHFKVHCQSRHQEWNIFSSVFAVSIIFAGSLPCIWRVVSSTKGIAFIFFNILGRWFIHMKKSIGHKTLPWQMPYFICCGVEVWFRNQTVCILLDKKSWNQSNMNPCIP